ncbi:MAG TPA: glycosyltransferase family 4 protein [Gaiellaceae bacterium]|nr:glycosyltransferase family 4 protein [Gaiellaceae bacterium]
MTRVAVIHHGFVPHYRVRFYELLNRVGEIEYVVVHGPPPPGLGSVAADGPFAFPNIAVRHHELRLPRRTAIYQSLAPVLREGFDAVVLGTHLLFLSNHLAFAHFKARGRPVLYWGHGRELAEPGLKSRLARLADGYLAYTEGGAAWLARQGVPAEQITVVRNTLDMDEQIELHARLEHLDDLALRRELGLRPDTTVLLFLGRMYPAKGVPQLVEAFRRLRSRGAAVELALIGGGPSLADVRAAADGVPGVHVTGELRDQERIARWLRAAAAVVIPGSVGLGVNHALAHGTPVITRAGARHAPEIEYVETGVNGLVVQGGLEDFVSALAAFVESPAEQRHLAAGALASRAALGLAPMVEAFDRGVRAALSARRASVPRRGRAARALRQTARS